MTDSVTFPTYDFQGDYSAPNLRRFLKHCHDHDASDILLQGGDYAWVEVHGRQRPATKHTLTQGNMPPIINALWPPGVEAAMRSGKGADRSLEIAGEEVGLPRGKTIRFRCNFIQARVAKLDEAFVSTLRVIGSEMPSIEAMGLDDELLDAYFPAQGVCLTCGPTGSGKTTLQTALYAYAGERMPDRKVITYEDPIEFVLGGPHWKGPQPAQSEIGRDIANFALGLKNAMRRKPSIIGIGEVRDLETADAMIETSMTGHTCYATLHTKSVAESINRVIQVYPPMQQSGAANRLLGSVELILVQRLLKTTDGKRAPIREYLIFDDEVRDWLQDQPYDRWAPMVRRRLAESGKTLLHQAWALHERGAIDADEFIALTSRRTYQMWKAGDR